MKQKTRRGIVFGAVALIVVFIVFRLASNDASNSQTAIQFLKDAVSAQPFADRLRDERVETRECTVAGQPARCLSVVYHIDKRACAEIQEQFVRTTEFVPGECKGGTRSIQHQGRRVLMHIGPTSEAGKYRVQVWLED